jgi:protein-tyrosine phosphatase
MHHISPYRLWLGHAGDGQDNRHILDAGIKAVVQLALEEKSLDTPRELLYFRIPLLDGSGNDAKTIQFAIVTVANLLEKNVPTLVVCGAGLSRAPAIAAAALANVFQKPPAECLKEVTEHCPADVSPALWDDINSSGTFL